ncbi:DUF4422 domain-containing protein [Lysinibacillus capsici]|uniref:DUF4422 domain-containing protein n=1 Tax=Lysinibacillus capsici TaxID=2115968 RepID=UPI0034E40B56
MEKIKIFTCYHKQEKKIENNIIKPLQVGASITDIDLGFLKDNTGDNISNKNATFCELTALYWMWKNYSHLNYLGLFHYRRQMILKNQEAFKGDQWGLVPFTIVNYSLDAVGLDEEHLTQSISEYDIILPERWDVRLGGFINMYQQYEASNHHFIEHLDIAIKIIEKKYPEFTESMYKSLVSTNCLFTNIFIMKYELLDDYCNWLFPILFEVEANVDSSNYSTQEKRYIGFLSERLFNIYFNWLVERKKYLKVKYAKRSFLR